MGRVMGDDDDDDDDNDDDDDDDLIMGYDLMMAMTRTI